MREAGLAAKGRLQSFKTASKPQSSSHLCPIRGANLDAQRALFHLEAVAVSFCRPHC